MAELLLHSILFHPGRVELSWSDPDGEGPFGMEIRTAVIDVSTGKFDAELVEMTDAATQLLTSWEGARREPPPRGLPAG